VFKLEFSSLTDKDAIQLSAEKLSSHLEDWEKDIWQFVSDWFNPSVACMSVFTSGSTAAPKLMQHSKGAMMNSARLTCEALHMRQNDKALLCLPANKISGMMMIARSIVNKMDLYCIRPSSNPLGEIHDKDKFDLAAFTPTQLFEVDKDSKKLKRLEKINKLLIGGEGMPPTLLNILQKLSNSAYATFGMTETISHIALRKLNGKDAADWFTTIGSIAVHTDERNCLIIEAPELGVRHLITNDEVHLISSTEFKWLGRKDNLINSGGVKIYPEKIEEQLKPLIQLPFFIAGIESNRTGQEVAIAIEKATFTLKEANELKKRFEILGKLYCPKTILTKGEMYYGEFVNGRLVKGYSKDVDPFGFFSYSKTEKGIKTPVEVQQGEEFFNPLLSTKQ